MTDGERAAPAPAADRSGWTVAALGAVALGLALRLAAARGDPWLDEIWSAHLAALARTALGVFTAIHHDNNHHLHTLWLQAVGPEASPFLQRLLAVGSGAGLVALGGAGLLRREPAEGAFAAILLAGSRLLVHYGSEARGYGPALFLGLGAFAALDRLLETRRAAWGAAFAATASLGLLAHLSFAYLLAGLLAWGALALARPGSPRGAVAWLAIPPAVLLLLWLVDLRELAVGGGPPGATGAVLRELLRAALGTPSGAAELLAAAAVALAGYELLALARARDPRAAFFAVALVLAPGAVLLARPVEHLAPRYFAVLVPPFLVLVAAGLARLLRRPGQAPAAAAAFLALFALGNAVQLAGLLRDGRGRYREAVALMLPAPAGGPTTVGSDHDFRNRAVLEDAARRAGVGSRLAYVEQAALPARPPDWFLIHDLAERSQGPSLIEVAGRPYGLVATFPHGGLSGWTWHVYRRGTGATR